MSTTKIGKNTANISNCCFSQKCPNTEFFLVRIFPYSVQIRETTDQKKLRIWTLFTQCTHRKPHLPLTSSIYLAFLPLEIEGRLKQTKVHFPKIHRSVLRKLTIDLLYFSFMTSIYEQKISAEVRLIHAEQMSLYNFIILRSKCLFIISSF